MVLGLVHSVSLGPRVFDEFALFLHMCQSRLVMAVKGHVYIEPAQVAIHVYRGKLALYHAPNCASGFTDHGGLSYTPAYRLPSPLPFCKKGYSIFGVRFVGFVRFPVMGDQHPVDCGHTYLGVEFLIHIRYKHDPFS